MRIESRRLYLLASSVLALAAASPAWAQVQAANSETASEEVIVTGTRGLPRTELNSPVPVDVISPEAIKAEPYADMDNILNEAIPSFNVTRDANTTSGTFIRPISIRGLPEDETLLLLDGHRRQLSASVGSGGTGAEGPDAAVIPTLALSSIQVLRDGASAQYGSDAIAGVVNFLLKNADHGFEVDAQLGTTSYLDGDTSMLAANIGLPLPFIDKGYLNMTAEIDTQERTTRAGAYINYGLAPAGPFNCQTYAAANPVYAAAINWNNGTNPKACVRYPTGQPSGDDFKSIINAGIPVTADSQLYTFANFSISDGHAFGSYRYPYNGQQVNGPTIRQADGSTFSFSQMFPAGWNPWFGAEVTDWSDVSGYRGSWQLGGQPLTYDFSGRFGWDRIAYHVDNTVNPSLGPTTPLHFDPYADQSNEKSLNADFSYPLETSFTATPIVLSAGAEYLHRSYRILGGNAMKDPASIVAGPYASVDPYGFCNDTAHTPTAKGLALPATAGLNCANLSDPVYQTLPAGSNSITGLPDISTGVWTDSNTSFYEEADTNIVQGWELDVAAREENYASFGTNTSEKIATHVQLTDWLAVRGSAGTGFHAPPPGMLNQTNVQLVTVNGAPVQSGLFPAANPVSTFLGAKPLLPEKAANFSAGFTADPFDNFTFTADAYWVRMFGQIYTVSPITVTPAIAAQITAAGIPGATSITSVDFLQNAFDSNTQGFDLVGTYNYPWEESLWGYDQTTHVTMTFNMNRYVITHLIIPNLFTAASKFGFEHGSPKWRSVVSVSQDVGPFTAMLRANLWGQYVTTTTTESLFQKYPFITPQFDAELSYKLNDSWKFTAGIQNLFNAYPETNQINDTTGTLYGDVGIPWQGSYYSIRMQFTL